MSRLSAVAGALTFLVPLLGGGGSAATAAASAEHSCVATAPEPDGSPVRICYSLYRPAAVNASRRVPVVMHGHHWGGARGSGITVEKWLRAGFGVLTFDQRGWGQSTGKSHWQHPEYEGRDVSALLDVIAGKDWVAREAADSTDPRVGTYGASYGGGFQFAGAFAEVMHRGRSRIDALAPQVTWWDWQESLAPAGVPKTAWLKVLQASGAGAMTAQSHRGFAYMDATGTWPADESARAAGADLRPVFEATGPKWHVSQGRRIDVPMLIGQGVNDNLFNLNQGLRIFDHALTPSARSRSLFVGYNGGGHDLPAVLPPGVSGVGDPCSPHLGGTSFEELAIRFFREVLNADRTGLAGHGAYHLATTGSRCVSVPAHSPTASRALGDVIATTGSGAAVHTKIIGGPARIFGTSRVETSVTTLVGDSRVFLALSVGTSPATARVVANNMSPLREWFVTARARRLVELPAVAVEVPAGQSLFLTVSPYSDTSFGHGGRAPSAVFLDDTVVHLPLR